MKIVAFLLMQFFIINQQFAQWQKTFDVHSSHFECFVNLPNDNIGFCGTDDSGRLLFLKIDYNGNTITKNSFDFKSGNPNPYNIIYTRKNEFYIVGGIHNKIGISFILCLSNDGDSLWCKEFSSLNINKVIENNNSEITLIGGPIGASGPIHVTRLDSNKKLIWEKTYSSGASFDLAWCGVESSKEEIVIASWNNETGISLLKIDKYGYQVFWKTIDRSTARAEYQFQDPHEIVECLDNGYAITGPKRSSTDEMYLVKTDVDGDTLFTKTYNYGISYGLKETNSGSFIMCGYRQNQDENQDYIILKTDSQGNELFRKSYDNNKQSDIAHSILVKENGGYYVCGSSGKTWIISTDSFGFIYSNDNIHINKKTKFNINPNPATNYVNINIEDYNKKDVLNFKLMNLNSQIILTRRIKPARNSQIYLNKFIPNGIYFAIITNSNGIELFREKLILQ